MSDEPDDDEDDPIQNVLAVGGMAKEIALLLTLYEQSNALNPDGQIYVTARQRDAETEMILSANDSLSCLFVSPSEHLWAAASSGNVYTTSAVSFPPPADAELDLDMPSPRFQWQVTTLPDVASTGVAPGIQSIWGAGDSDVFAASAEGAIFHWNGTAWAETPSGVTTELLMLHGTGSDDVYCVGEAAVILHYDGNVWTRVAVPDELGESDMVTAVWAVSPGEAYACSVHGKVLKGNRNGFQIVAEDEEQSWYGVVVFQDQPVLASTETGAWALTPTGLVLMRDRFNPTGVFDGGDRLYFIETEQDTPCVIEYAPSEARPWGRRSF
jgi:hypothetical protein